MSKLKFSFDEQQNIVSYKFNRKGTNTTKKEFFIWRTFNNPRRGWLQKAILKKLRNQTNSKRNSR
jgi:hypothetical protein